MKITGLSHLFKWENLHNWWLTKYFFAPLYISNSSKVNVFFLCIYCIVGFMPQANFFVLELKKGFLRLMYDFGFTNGPVIMESNLAKLQINDARYHEVMLSLHHFQGIH